ncbi:LysR family transcriptional regulator [Terrarubrum flagellatum]|uniref:LysR family transcriptional regulator n=1 Tax=Terrirubrum flagellatum TaxID=2895980 RepID=UPI003144F573
MKDWDDIRIFLAVSRAGSLNAGARLLGLTQPTVSRRIHLFEGRLGVSLFGRTQDGLVLTEAGKSLWHRALAIEEHAEAISRQVLRHDDRMGGVVRISATEGLGAFWLTKRLTRLATKHPHITTEILLDNGVTDLMKRDADVAIRLGRPQARELIAKRVGDMRFSLFASRDYVARHGAPAELRDVLRHPLVTFMWDGASGGDEWRDLVASHPQVAFKTNSSIAQVYAVRAGFGVGLLPTYVQEDSPDLMPILPGQHWPHRDIWLVAHRDVKMSPRIRAVYNEIAAQFTESRRTGGARRVEELAQV